MEIVKYKMCITLSNILLQRSFERSNFYKYIYDLIIQGIQNVRYNLKYTLTNLFRFKVYNNFS